MRSIFLLAVLALSASAASAEPFRYVGFAELRKDSVEKDLAKARDLKAALVASFDSEGPLGWSLKDSSDKGLFAFNRLEEDFYQALKAVADADPANAELKALADWGYATHVKLRPGDLFSERLLADSDYDSLKLR